MMEMAKMEEALDKSWMEWPLPTNLRQNPRSIFSDGFRAGAAWAIRQAKNQGSPQAVGNMVVWPDADADMAAKIEEEI